MSRRGDPRRNPRAQRFSTTLQIDAASLNACGTSEDVAADLPRFIDDLCNAGRLHASPGHLCPVRFEDRDARRQVESAA